MSGHTGSRNKSSQPVSLEDRILKGEPNRCLSLVRKSQAVGGVAHIGVVMTLVSKMAHACEGHRETAFIGGGNYLVVSNRAARLNHAGCARIRRSNEPVGERKEGVAADGAPF